jgi:hypothetical protein
MKQLQEAHACSFLSEHCNWRRKFGNGFWKILLKNPLWKISESAAVITTML